MTEPSPVPEPVLESVPEPRVLAVQAGLAYLLRAQHPAGSFTDFWLPVGTSGAWVTAFTGLALHAVAVCPWLPPELCALADAAARRAARWLLDHPHPRGGWGYNANVSADADSTAHALSLLARLKLEIPAEAVALLQTHRDSDSGFRTYAWAGPAHPWTQPCPDVSAAALRALSDLGELTDKQLRAAWKSMLGQQQRPDGLWEGYWWQSCAYPSGLILEVWEAAGRPDLRFPACLLPQYRWPSAPSTFDLAWQARAQSVLHNGSVSETLAALLHAQTADGAWPSSPLLRVPPAHPTSGPVTLVARDARRIFTSASVLRALVLAPPDFGPIRLRTPLKPVPQRRLPARFGERWSELISSAAQATGFSALQAQAAQDLFAQLTQHSLDSAAQWPSPQLTALSGGMPLEFSCTVGARTQPALRYAAEVSDPFLPPPARVQTGLGRLCEVARQLGYSGVWQRLWPALQLLTDPMQDAPDGTRFTVWGGIDQAAPSPGQSQPPPLLKLYLNTLHRELGGGRARLNAALQAAGVPVPAPLNHALNLLDAAGFPQEIGFALAPHGQMACKVYYELPGWKRPLLAQLLDLCNLPGEAEQLTPEIPGLIRAGLAAKSRAGIGLRLNPGTGQISELMVACAFPVPLIPLATTIQRVGDWLETQGDAAPYFALAQVLGPAWTDRDSATRAMHSLFTRTVSVKGSRTTVYLRPMFKTAF